MNKYMEQLEENDQDLDARARQIISNTTYQGCALLAAAYENVNKGLETELKELRESISRPVQQILNTEKELHAQVEELRSRIEDKTRTILELQRSSSLSACAKRTEELLEENNKLRGRIKKLAVVKYDLEAEVATWDNHYSQASNEVDRLREENQKLHAQVEGTTNAELRERLKRAQAAKEAALAENTALRSKLGLRNKTIREMERAQVQYVEDLEKRIADLERDNEKAWSRGDDIERDLNVRTSELSREHSHRLELEERLEKAEVALDTFTATNNRLRDELTGKNRTIRELEKKLADLQHAYEQSQKTTDWVIDSNQKHIVSMCHMTLEAAVGSIAHCEDGIFPDTIHVEDEGLVYVVAAGSREQNIALLDKARDRVMRYGMPLDDEEPGEEDHAQDRVEAMEVPEGEYVIGRTNFEHSIVIRVHPYWGVQLGYGEPGYCKLSYETIKDPRLTQLLYRMAKDQK